MTISEVIVNLIQIKVFAIKDGQQYDKYRETIKEAIKLIEKGEWL